MVGRPPICDGPDAIDADWMRRALAAGGTPGAAAITDVAVEDLGSATNAFGRLLRCHLTARGGAAVPASVIVKLPTADRTAFRFARWLWLHERECFYYRRVAPHARIRSPALLYGDFEEDTHRFVLVLEDLRDLEAPVQSVGVGAARARLAVREIAKLHGQFWGAAGHAALSSCRDVLGPRFARSVQIAYSVCLPAALERFADSFTPRTRRLVEALGPRLTAYYAAVAAGPRTFIHGDYRGENMFFAPAAGSDDSVRPTADDGAVAPDAFAVIDWQGCGLGAGLYDVAYFLGTNLVPDERRRVEREAVEEYHDIVCRAGAGSFTSADCWRGYRRNMLGVLMPCILGCGGVDLGDPRFHDLVKSGLGRALAAMEDLDVEEFLPARRRGPTAGDALAALSRCGHAARRLSRRLFGRGAAP